MKEKEKKALELRDPFRRRKPLKPESVMEAKELSPKRLKAARAVKEKLETRS
jgi:hypothetical protein